MSSEKVPWHITFPTHLQGTESVDLTQQQAVPRTHAQAK